MGFADSVLQNILLNLYVFGNKIRREKKTENFKCLLQNGTSVYLTVSNSCPFSAHTPHPIHTGSESPQGSKQLSCCGLLFCFLRFFFSFFSKWLNTKIKWCYMLVAQTIKRILRCINFSDSSFVFEWKFFPYHYLPFLLHFLKYRSEFSTNLMHLRICIWSGLYWQCHWTFTGTALNYKYYASWSM